MIGAPSFFRIWWTASKESLQDTSGSVTFSMRPSMASSRLICWDSFLMNSITLTGSGRNLATLWIFIWMVWSRSSDCFSRCSPIISPQALRTCIWCFCTSMKALEALSSMVAKSR